LGFGFRVKGLGVGITGPEFELQGLSFCAYGRGIGYNDLGLRLRVTSLGLRVRQQKDRVQCLW
jgi:hypothetical protein